MQERPVSETQPGVQNIETNHKSKDLRELERGYIHALMVSAHTMPLNVLREDLLTQREITSSVRWRIVAAAIKVLDAGRAPTFDSLWGEIETDRDAFEELLECSEARHTTLPASALTLRRLAAYRMRANLLDRARAQSEGGEPVDPFTLARDLSELEEKKDAKEYGSTDLAKMAFRKLRDMEENKNNATRLNIAPLDDVLGGLDPGSLTVVGARPSVGKSTLALFIARQAAQQGIVVFVASCEDAPETWSARYTSAATGIAALTFRTGRVLPEDAQGAFQRTGDVFETPEGFILADLRGKTLSEIEHVIDTRARAIKADIVIVDYAQKIRNKNAKQDRRNEIDDVIDGMKDACGRIGAHCILLSQLRREEANAKDQEPRLSQLKESGRFEEAAENVLLMWRGGGGVEARLVKNKNGRNGVKYRFIQSSKTAAFESVREVIEQ